MKAARMVDLSLCDLPAVRIVCAMHAAVCDSSVSFRKQDFCKDHLWDPKAGLCRFEATLLFITGCHQVYSQQLARRLQYCKHAKHFCQAMPIPFAESDAKQRWPDVNLVVADAYDVRAQHVKGLTTNLWHSREDGDFVFTVAGGTIRAHSCILSAASPVFKAMLASGMTEGLSSSVLLDAEPSELLAMLRFIYTGELDATAQQLPGVLALAHRYEVLNMIPPLCEAMIDSLNIDTAAPYIRVLRLLEGCPGVFQRQPSESRKYKTVESYDSPGHGLRSTEMQAWMALPATGSLPSIPPAVRIAGPVLSQSSPGEEARRGAEACC